MKKFLKKVIAYFLVTATLCFVPSMIVDPCSVFHPLNVRDNGVEPNKNYTKNYYILHNPDEFDSFVMGSSHSAVLDVRKLPGHAYNLYYSGGLPVENLANLKTFIKNGIVPKRIYIGVDNISLKASWEDHCGQQLRAPYEYSQEHPLDFWMLYLDPVVNLLSARWTIQAAGKGVFNLMQRGYYDNGGVDAHYDIDNTEIIDRSEAVHETYSHMLQYLEETPEYPLSSANSASVIDSVAEMRQICDEYGIELTVLINPMYFDEFQESVENDAFLSVLRGLAEVTPYYSFCGYNKYTTDARYYFADNEHYCSNLADYMIDCFLNGKVDPEAYAQGFGVYVTKDNVEDLIAVITDPSASW